MRTPVRIVAGSAGSAASLIVGDVLFYLADTRSGAWPDSLQVASLLAALLLLVLGLFGMVGFAVMASDPGADAMGGKPAGDDRTSKAAAIRDPYILAGLCFTAAVYIVTRLLLPQPIHDLVMMLYMTIAAVIMFGLTAKLALTRHSR
jgi:hypothetical protein